MNTPRVPMIADAAAVLSSAMFEIDNAKRLMLRKQALFRRAYSLDSLLAVWGLSPSPTTTPKTIPHQRKLHGYEPNANSQADVGTPLLAQRWEMEQKLDKAPSCPCNDGNARSEMPSLFPSVRTTPSSTLVEKVVDTPRLKFCRWNSDKSLEKDSMPKARSRRGSLIKSRPNTHQLRI